MKLLILLFVLTGCFGSSGGDKSSPSDQEIKIDQSSVTIPTNIYLGFLKTSKEYIKTIKINNTNDFAVPLSVELATSVISFTGCSTIPANGSCDLKITTQINSQKFSSYLAKVNVADQSYYLRIKFTSYSKGQFTDRIKYKLLEQANNGHWYSDLNHDFEFTQYVTDILIDRFSIDDEENYLFDFIGYLSNTKDVITRKRSGDSIDLSIDQNFYNEEWKTNYIPSGETEKGTYVKELFPSYIYLQDKIRNINLVSDPLGDLDQSEIDSFLEKTVSSNGNIAQGIYSKLMDQTRWEREHLNYASSEENIMEKKLRDTLLLMKTFNHFGRNDLKEDLFRSIINHLPRVTNSDSALDNFQTELSISMNYNEDPNVIANYVLAKITKPFIVYNNSCKLRALQMTVLESIDTQYLSTFESEELSYVKNYLWGFLGDDFLNFDGNDSEDLLCLPYLLNLSNKTDLIDSVTLENLHRSLLDNYLSCSSNCIYDSFSEELTFLLEYSNKLD